MPSKTYLRWRREMIDAYYEERIREILQPVAGAAHAWEAGDLSSSGFLDEIFTAQRAARSFNGGFVGGHDILEGLIRADERWFATWVQDHPQPAESGPA